MKTVQQFSRTEPYSSACGSGHSLHESGRIVLTVVLEIFHQVSSLISPVVHQLAVCACPRAELPESISLSRTNRKNLAWAACQRFHLEQYLLLAPNTPAWKTLSTMPNPASAPQPPMRTSQIPPIEIWTIILELTIHVPRLLDTACVSFVQYSGLGSERRRLILQNVCSAWRKSIYCHDGYKNSP